MIKTLIGLFCLLFFVGCSTNQNKLSSNELIEENAKKHLKNVSEEVIVEFKTPKPINVEKNVELPKPIDTNQAIMQFYKEWKNVKYKLGGNSKKGIDCSAFTQRIFKEKFEIQIPRTTRTQVKVGKKIKKSELELGDLVFFKTGKTDRHVGIYMGNGDFLHASIKGVKFTKLNKPFYKKAYWTSRRILEDKPMYLASASSIK